MKTVTQFAETTVLVLDSALGHLLRANVKISIEEARAEIAKAILDIGQLIELARAALPAAPYDPRTNSWEFPFTSSVYSVHGKADNGKEAEGKNRQENQKAFWVRVHAGRTAYQCGPISSEDSQPHDRQQTKDVDRPEHIENVVLLLSLAHVTPTGCAVPFLYRVRRVNLP